MNFSLKKPTKAPPSRKKLGEEEEQTEQPQKVRQVEAVKSHDPEICLPSNSGWILAAADKQEKHSIDLETAVEQNKYLSKEAVEDMLYEQGLQEHPNPPTAKEYDELSVEDFGAALLRGLGKDPGSIETAKENMSSQARRSTHLGVGAKPGTVASGLNVPLTKRRKKTDPSKSDKIIL